MTDSFFDTALVKQGERLVGPLRKPRQMLNAQSYDNHASIHDDATAQKLGFKGGTIEGPTHFSQFAPLGAALWGRRWFEEGCLSAHYRNAAYEGEAVRAFIEAPRGDIAVIGMEKEDGTEVLRGTASVGSAGPTALAARLSELKPLEKPVILRDVKVGMRQERHPVSMAADQNMGALYPFSLTQKLAVITEPSRLYSEGGPWGGAIVPMEMISVLLQYSSRRPGFPVRGPAVGLFADQEIRLLKGPVIVGAPYEIEREVVFLSGSRRTESMWVRTMLYPAGGKEAVAEMLLNSATLVDSYAPYAAERAALYGEG